MKILFDEGPLGGGTLFDAPVRLIRADGPDQVPEALDQIARAQAEGHWLAGCFSYELGYCLTERLAPLPPRERRVPLILMGVFGGCRAPAADAPAPAFLSPPCPAWDSARYGVAFDRVRDYIAAGDCYQINLTFPQTLRATGTPDALYAALRRVQPVRHGALVDLGGPVILSRSPELFFAVDADGMIETRPMKGTVARGATPGADRAARDWLGASEKNRAENLMIVDLLRNDLSRISRVGSVRVPRLFEVESYATVHQMTSTVRAQLLPGTNLPAILHALFPCGSVTGAPKIRAMEIIRELEPAPRDAYCGAIGWVAPDGRMSFNVAIRTLTLHDDGEAVLNVGGGVVHDSTGDAEYAEALLKAGFARLPGSDLFGPDLQVIETLGSDGQGGFVRLDLHLDRLRATCARLGLPLDMGAVRAALADVPRDGPRRVRLAVDAGGRVALTHAPCPPVSAPWRLRIAAERLDSADPWLGMKTTHRAIYDRARAALPEAVDELLFLNERDEVCEGTITNVFARLDGQLCTPPLACGLLPGVLRRDLIDRGEAVERILTPTDLTRAEALFVGNSLRGLIPAVMA